MRISTDEYHRKLEMPVEIEKSSVVRRQDNQVYLGSSMEREVGYDPFERAHHELQGGSANSALQRLANSLVSTELHRSDSGRSLRLRPSNNSAEQTITAHCLTPRAPRGVRPGGRRPQGATVMVPHQTCMAFKLDNNSNNTQVTKDDISSDDEEPESISATKTSNSSNSGNQKAQEGALEKRRSSFSIATHILAQLQEDKLSKAEYPTEALRYSGTISENGLAECDDGASRICDIKCETPKTPPMSCVSSEPEKNTPNSLYTFSLWSNAIKRPILPEAVGARNDVEPDMIDQIITQRPRPRCYSSEAIPTASTAEVVLPLEEKGLKDARDMIARLRTDDNKSTASFMAGTPQNSSPTSREMSLTRSMSPKISKSSMFVRTSSSLPTSAPVLPPRSTSLDSTIGKTTEAFPKLQSSEPLDPVYGNQKTSHHSQRHSLGTGSITEWKRGTLIGEGTFGKVYMGLNIATGELFAMKEVEVRASSLNEHSDPIKQLYKLGEEISLMENLDHSHIVRYKGSHRNDNIFYIFMEYVPGGTIASMLKQFDAFSEPLIRIFVRQIVAGVAYLHRMGIVHRDIKGANVLVNEQGVAKLADFGCSKQLTDIQSTSLEESLRSIRGSVPWMAPEVVKQTGHDYKADIWSIGATMIEMATAKYPWPDSNNSWSTMLAIANATEPPPFPPNLSQQGTQFLKQCMRIDPAVCCENDRFQVITGSLPAIFLEQKNPLSESSRDSMSFLSYPTGVRMTAQNVEKLQARRRCQEQDALSLRNFTNSNQIQVTEHQAEASVAYKRRSNQTAQFTAERILEQTEEQAAEEKARRLRETQQNELVAQTLEAQKRAKEQKEREIQRICESSEDIHELQAILKTAYMNKERATQQLEKETLHTIEKQRQVAMEQQMEYDRQKALVERENEEILRKVQAQKASQVLQQQMLDRRELEKESREVAELERQRIEELVRQIELEDLAEIEKRNHQRIQTRQMIMQTQQERAAVLRSQAEKDRQQEERILEYQQQVAAREAAAKASTEHRKAAQDATFKAIETEIKAKMRQDEEMEQLRDELWEEEMYQKKKEQDGAKQAAKRQAKEVMMTSNAEQVRYKQEIQARQKAEEEAFNQSLKQKFKSEARRDMELAIFRRKQKEEFQREIADQKAYKQRMILQQVEIERREREAEENEEAYRRQVIEEAKRRLLEQHAEALEGYLPKHLLRPGSGRMETSRFGS
uniref:Meiosis-specific nuclear structural protein 1 n=1 Tax=Albugo laibachii Nc14 TaxID=890382 RepID=F0W683_9STRA|nr:mitogenactivated protein kinase kinase kinase putati [Albugo laibachii Nc14]|eukprot:CCA16625.1 mitogenactivated protein kinase kinase kinase putati [Albugo laibachii Nc14]